MSRPHLAQPARQGGWAGSASSVHTDVHAHSCTDVRTHFHTLGIYAWTQAIETPVRGFTHPYIKLTLRQEFFHKGSTPTALGSAPGHPSLPTLGNWGTHLGDLGVGALNIVAGPVKPGAGGAATVLLEGAPALTAAPATLELPVGLEAEATALPLGCTLVEVDCRERGGSHRWGWRGRLTIYPLLAGVIETAPIHG